MSSIVQFRKSFKIDKTANLKEVAVSIAAIYSAQHFAFEKLGDIEPSNPSEGFRIQSFLNLLSRTFEHAQAALVSLATGSPTSAEALGRIVIEGAVNISCLALKGDAGTLVRFFRVWLDEHDRKLTEWKSKAPTADAALNVPAMIEERRKVIQGMDQFLTEVEKQCGIAVTTSPNWPKTILQRFQAIGRETDYYESYHRLSGSSHLTGEDTLMWLMTQHVSDELRRQVALEAWAYSTMMTRMACAFFMDAVVACCAAHGIQPSAELTEHRQALVDSIEEIVVRAGVPVGAGSKRL